MFPIIPANKSSLTRRKLVYGVGFNDADYIVKPKINGKEFTCHFYDKWKGMLGRCYSIKSHQRRPNYVGCTVVEEWLTFSNFKEWMTDQYWECKHLDKDILTQGNKLYSPATCIFVTPAINNLLLDHGARRGEFPVGACFHKASGKFLSKCSVNGKTKHLGLFATPEEASAAYKLFKYELIAETAILQTEPLRSALLNYELGVNE